MKPLHIAFFNRAFYPEVSATGQLLTELAEDLANNYGCRVSVVAGMPQGSIFAPWSPPKKWHFVTKEEFGKITIFRARGSSFAKSVFAGRVCNYLTYFGSACVAAFRLEQPDVVIALTDPPVIGLAALMAARRFRAKLIISYRDLFPEVARLLKNFRNPFVETVLHQVNRILISQADRIIALGDAMQNRLVHEKGAPLEKVSIIPDWADASNLTPGPKQNPFSRAQQLENKFVVMHSGNIGASQNLEVLIEAADRLKNIPDLEFILIGEGLSKPALQSRAKDLSLSNVRFLPYQPKETLRDVFATADCFIVSLKTGLSGYIMPSKLYGILAAGRPCVAAVEETCDVAQITRRYQSGLLARQQDPADWAEKILCLYNNKPLAQKMGSNAALASENFSRARGVQAYYDLCCSLLSKSGFYGMIEKS